MAHHPGQCFSGCPVQRITWNSVFLTNSQVMPKHELGVVRFHWHFKNTSPLLHIHFYWETSMGLWEAWTVCVCVHQMLCALLVLLTSSLVWTILLAGLPQSLPGADWGGAAQQPAAVPSGAGGWIQVGGWTGPSQHPYRCAGYWPVRMSVGPHGRDVFHSVLSFSLVVLFFMF